MKEKRAPLWWLFCINLLISTFTFGGGYVVIPMIRRYFVERRGLLTEEELLDFIHANYPEIGEKIRQNGSLDEDAEKLLVASITRLKEAKYHG